MPTIKGKLGGFNKKEVDEHIRKIKKAQDVELEDLSKKIDVCQWEIEILKQEFDSLKQKDLSLPDQDLLEFAINRADRVLGFMDQDVTIDVLAIDKITQQKVIALENSIEELDIDIEKEKEIIEKELNNIAEIAKGQDRVKNINIDVIKNIGKVLPIADWLKSNREEQANSDKEFWGEEPKRNSQESCNPMTSDGMSLADSKTSDINSNLTDPLVSLIDKSSEIHVSSVVKVSNRGDDEDNKDLEEHNEVQERLEEEQEENQVEFQEQVENQIEFQEAEQEEIVKETIGEVDQESLQNDENKEAKEDATNIEIDSTFFESPEIEEPFFSVSKTDFWDVSSSSEDAIPSIQEVAATENDIKAKAPSQDLSKPFETSDANSQTSPSGNGLSQANVRDEISAVRDKYIIGRVVGEDIADSTGQVIIRKDEPITLSLMQLAQKEGKLADLIIHMVLPGQEE